MSKYEMQQHQDMDHTFYVIRDLDTMKWFAGYDFMGSAEWVDDPSDSYEMSQDEAEAILADLTAAADPEETEVQPADPVLDHLQMALDIAYNDRNNAFQAYEKACKSEQVPAGLVNSTYNYYQQRQNFYEGVVFAINAAGYRLESIQDSDKLRVIK